MPREGSGERRFERPPEGAAERLVQQAPAMTIAPPDEAAVGPTNGAEEPLAGPTNGADEPLAGPTNGADEPPVAATNGAAHDADELLRRVTMAAESDLEAFRYAHWRGTVTFHEVAASWFHMSDPNLPDDLRDEFKTIYPGLLDAFAEPRKGIITAYFCRHIRVAAALTDIGHAADAPEGVPQATLKGPPPESIRTMIQEQQDDPRTEHKDWICERTRAQHAAFWRRVLPGGPKLFDPAPAASSAIHIEPTFGDPEDWKAKEILFQCLHLHYKALEFLTPQPRKICLRMIFGVITTLLGTLDHRQLERNKGNIAIEPFGTNPAEVATLERELDQAQRYYEAAAQRQAQLDYLVGMVRFIVIAVAATAAIVVFRDELLNEAATVAVLGGAAGAIVSVLNRMTGGRLKVRPEAGRKTIRALGFMRPVIGAVFGAVVYLFLDGGIVQVLAPPQGGANLAFYAGLGFISGFSERFAQDVIAQASRDGQPRERTPALREAGAK